MPDLAIERRRYNLLRICLLLSVSVLAFAIPVYAATVATQTTTGHIKVINGTNAGILVTPSNLEFGSVVWGQTVTLPITVMNNGDCVENVVVSASQSGAPTIIASIPQILPGHTVTVQATYDTSQFLPGDYTFTLDWTATCL